jgi:YidC/Oxa1 family membrane protein insertase
MQEQQNNPFSGKFLIAMIIFAVFYFGWNSYLQKKYPGYGKKPVTASEANPTGAPVAAADSSMKSETTAQPNTAQ